MKFGMVEGDCALVIFFFISVLVAQTGFQYNWPYFSLMPIIVFSFDATPFTARKWTVLMGVDRASFCMLIKMLRFMLR